MVMNFHYVIMKWTTSSYKTIYITYQSLLVWPNKWYAYSIVWQSSLSPTRNSIIQHSFYFTYKQKYNMTYVKTQKFEVVVMEILHQIFCASW